MTEAKAKIVNHIIDLKSYADKYKLPGEKLESYLENADKFKYRLPLIGEFSAGKSSLLNSLLDEELLRVNIQPETALPCEIEYGESNKFVLKTGDNIRGIDKLDILNGIDNVEKGTILKATINNSFLMKIPSLSIVDMPGINSGYDVHNRAIDEYMKDCLSYILILSSEDGITKQGIAFLKELKFYDTPLHVFINKSDLKTNEIDSIIKRNEKIIEKYLGRKPDHISALSARKGDIDQLRYSLLSLEKDSDEVSLKYYFSKLNPIKVNLIQALQLQLDSWGKDLSELEQEEQKLLTLIEQQIRDVKRKTSEIQDNFNNAVNQIESSVSNVLNSNIDQFADTISNGGNVQNEINQLLRATVTEGLKNFFLSPSEKTIEILMAEFSSKFNDFTIGNENSENGEDGMVDAVANVVGGILADKLGKSETSKVFITVIFSVIKEFIKSLFSSNSGQSRIEQAKSMLYGQFPSILSQVRSSLLSKESEIVSSVINPFLDIINEKEKILQKSIQDIKERIKSEVEEDKKLKEILESDIIYLKNLKLQ